MPKWSQAQIKNHAIQELEQAGPTGLRYSELHKKLVLASPETSPNTITGSLHVLSTNPIIVRPSRGLWVLKKHWEAETDERELRPKVDAESEPAIAELQVEKVDEAAYYQPLKEWLIDQEEVIEAMVIGGSAFKNKWATPDVIGTYKPKKSDPVSFPIELISAEVKIDGSQSITAFGQACAYRLFSHKTFIVMPKTISKNDLDRLDALCSLYGMGLVLFELNHDAPNFQMKLRPQRLEPDIYYVNDFARRLLEISQADFDRLFG